MSNDLRALSLWFVFIALPSLAVADGLATIRENGTMEFAAYADFAPFSHLREGKAQGVDIDLAEALARELGVKAKFRLVLADESMEDDLRNNVWKGHYMGAGVADVMLHVPADPAFTERVAQVRVTRPYYIESVAVARSRQLENEHTLAVFARKPIGVKTASLADLYLLDAFGGKLRNQVRHYPKVQDATAALTKGEIAAVMGTLSEIEDGLGTSRSDYVVSAMPTPGLVTTRWPLGLAVKAENAELFSALEAALSKLVASGEVEAIFARHNLTYTRVEPAVKTASKKD